MFRSKVKPAQDDVNQYKLLYVAFHYPPALGSSGVHRTVVNSRWLAKKGYCEVLTCSTAAYEKIDNSSVNRIPKSVNVIRAWGRSTAKTFAYKGKHLRIMAQPDNWLSWIPFGIFSGIYSSLKQKPNAIISTYPISSALIIGYVLAKLFRLPWLVDLRDPLLQPDYPNDQRKRRIFKWLESKITKHASVVVVTTPGTKMFYQEKFPNLPAHFWQLVPNGYDDLLFDTIEKSVVSKSRDDSVFTLLHSGVVYPSERNPEQLFCAISELKAEGRINGKKLNIVLRATGNDQYYQQVIDQLDISDIVHLKPLISVERAIAEMFNADALLILQDANCNNQIPAKTYEYIRAGKPILALTPKEGDTGQLLSTISRSTISPLDDKHAIKKALLVLVTSNYDYVKDNDSSLFGREQQARNFTKIVEDIIESPNKYRCERT